MQPGLSEEVSWPLSSERSKDTWADKQSFADQGLISIFYNYDSYCPESIINFSPVSRTS